MTLECDEFTSKCPVTGQPDFARLVIQYQPGNWIVETKSLKLYLQGFREWGDFNEVIAERIAGDLYDRLEPVWIRLTGHFAARGGIRVNAVITFGERGPWLDAPVQTPGVNTLPAEQSSAEPTLSAPARGLRRDSGRGRQRKGL